MTIKEQKLFRAGLDILEDWCPRNQEDYLCGGNLPEDYWDETYCLYKLPCGYCKILEKPCPVSYNNGFIYNDKICDPPYNLNQVTCKMEEI